MPRKFRTRNQVASYNRRQFGKFAKKTWKYTKEAMPVALQALRVAKGVASLLNVEFKVSDTAHSAVNIIPTGAIYIYSRVAEDDTKSGRDGENLKAKQLYHRMKLNYNTSGQACQLIRVIFFVDRHYDGADPSVTEILEASDVYSPRNLDYVPRFRILSDKVYNLRSEYDGKFITNVFKFDHDVKFKGTTSAAGDASNGQIGMMILTDEASVNYPTFSGKARFRYIDN